MQKQIQFLLLNVAHLLDHLFMLIFASLAALVLSVEWGLDYAELIPYATPGFIAFGAFAVPAGWLADRWDRHAMIVVFFVGIGLSAVLAAMSNTPVQMSLALFFIGLFAAIYHPVGIALVLEGQPDSGMRVAINGVWGNIGVGVAALLTAYLIDTSGWRAAFVWPGVVSVLLGVAYYFCSIRDGQAASDTGTAIPVRTNTEKLQIADGNTNFTRVLAVVFLSTALGGLLFQSTTFALPRILAERAGDLSVNALFVGKLAFIAFLAGSMGQLLVGYLLDRISPRRIFMTVAAMQVVFFAIAVTAYGRLAIFAAVGYMLAVFGQIPINDILIGRVTRPEIRSRVLGIRYTITILVMASSIPLIAGIHLNYGFEALFKLLAVAAAAIFLVVSTLPYTLAVRSSGKSV